MEDPDDLHVCLKCHDQIVGLDNYIEHRRSNCREKPQKDNNSDPEAGVCDETAVQEPSDIEVGNIPNKISESNNGIARETDLRATDQGNDDGLPDAKICQQKRKRGRPRKILQTTTEEASISTSLQSGYSLKTKRNPSASPIRRSLHGDVQDDEKETNTDKRKTRKRFCVPIRFIKDDIGASDDSESDDELQKRHSRSTKTRKSRKSKTFLTDEEKALVAESKVENHYNCSPCRYKSTNVYSMLKHMKTIKHLESAGSSNPEAMFQCDTCPLRFNSEKGLNRHKLRHEKQCKCSKCNAEFETRKELQTHHKTEHGLSGLQGQAGNVQACETCGKVLSKGYMKIHLRIHTGEKPFSCDICPFKTNQQGDLRMHQKRHYGIKDHKCSLCNFVTVKASILKNHMKLHTKRERTEACHLCPQKFYNQGLLKSHIHLRHEPSRVHLCTFPGCTYKFKCRVDLVTHTRRHTNEKPFLCTVCGYSGSTKQALARHSRKHTGAKPFKCDHPGCSYMGRVSTHLTRHKRLHTGAKPYKCPYCSYRANTHENVRKHIRNTKKHAGLSVYVCKFCSDMQTDLYKDLVDHMRQKHADDYITFDQVSHQMGLLADKEEPPDDLDMAETANEKEQRATLTTKLSQEFQLALESDKVSQDVLIPEDNRHVLEIKVTSSEAGQDTQIGVTDKDEGHNLEIGPTDTEVVVPVTEVGENLCTDYILCRVIQDSSRQPQQRQGDGSENAEGSEVMVQDSEEMQEIQMVTVEEGQASEAIEMILRQAVSNGSRGPQDYVII